MTIRGIAPLTFPDIEPGGAVAARPRYAEVNPVELLVDDDYQRNLSERSRSLIRRLIANWDWRAFKPPNVVETNDGLHIIDGQHTAIAAASHPAVGLIPVMIVDAPEKTDRASAFVRLNRDRINISTTQLYTAMVAAGDPDALTIAQVCERAGARILKAPPGDAYWKVGDTVSVHTIQAVVRRRHALGARRVLELLVKAQLAPLTRDAILAVEALLFEAEYSEAFDPEDLEILVRSRIGELQRQAKVFAIEHKVPHWRGLAALLFRNVRKRRGPRPQN